MLISFFFASLLLFMIAALFLGAPLVPSKRQTAQKMVELLQVKKGENIFDLGSGDGRLLIIAATKGANAYGIELNPYAILLTYIKSFFSGVFGRVKVRWGNYWRVDISKADKVAVYGLPHIMPKMAEKFQKELKKGTLIVSNSFKIPGLKLVKEEIVGKNRVFLYKV